MGFSERKEQFDLREYRKLHGVELLFDQNPNRKAGISINEKIRAFQAERSGLISGAYHVSVLCCAL